MFQKSELDLIIEALAMLESSYQQKLEAAEDDLEDLRRDIAESIHGEHIMTLQGKVSEVSGKIVEIKEDIAFNRSVIRTAMMTRDLSNVSELSPEDAFKAGWQFAEKYFDEEKKDGDC